MRSRHILRSLPGQVAFVLATVIGTVAVITAAHSFFYEGWGQGAANAATYPG